MKIENPEKDSRLDHWMFWLCMIDIFFLPYVWFVSVLYTMPFIYYWVIKRYSALEGRKDFKLFSVLLLLMAASTVYSYVLAPGYAYKNTVYLIQFTTIFLYYFLFSFYLQRYPFQAKRILYLFLAFMTVLAVCYCINKGMYHQLRIFWNYRSGISINDTVYEEFTGYRYAFIFMDANNAGYLADAVLLYLLCNEKIKIYVKILSTAACVFILTACMSNGAIVAFGVGAVAYLFVKLRKLPKVNVNQKFQLSVGSVLIYLTMIIAAVYLIPLIPEYFKSGVGLEFLDRISENSPDSRFRIWEYIMQHVDFWEYLLIGKGGVTLVDGVSYAPHNGHLYLILNYGFIAYFIFMYLVFRKRAGQTLETYIWILPIFIGFSINVMLGEIKLMGVVMLLLACCESRLVKEQT